MARARSIKPGYFKNEALAELPCLARVLFAGLWTIADRAGRMEDRPKRIKMEILPYDKCDIDKLLNDLARYGFIDRYKVEGQAFIAIPTWDKHQNPHKKEAASSIPAPCKNGALPSLSGTSRADSLNPVPLTLNPEPCNSIPVRAPGSPPAKRILSLEAVGFSDWEEFDSWYKKLYAEHPTKGDFGIGRDYLRGHFIKGSFTKNRFEEIYASHRASNAWTRDRGRNCPKLSTFCNDDGCTFMPSELAATEPGLKNARQSARDAI